MQTSQAPFSCDGECAKSIEGRVTGIRSKRSTSRKGVTSGGVVFSRGSLYYLLASPIYIGKLIHKDKVHDGLHEAIIDQETWDATRAMMKSHEPNRNGRPSSDSQRFLRGLLYLPDGRRLGPTHATKGNRRYPYYFTGSDLASRAEPVRLPALELERSVAEAVRGLLENPLQLSEHFSALPIRDTQRLLASAQEKALKLADVATTASRLMIRSMLLRVTIRSGDLSIDIDRSSLVTETPDSLGAPAPSKPITLTVPYEIARRGRQVRLVITGSASAEQAPIPSLIRAVAMARDWAARIAAGEIFELNELAREYGIERSYAQKVFRCLALSPQHVEGHSERAT
jgi:site-specific DNA recombinase